ncbi:MAG: hypothetical protein HC884_08670 [Chloroflexaceae bacterium]|nr:hypothetical protein [Chloroflexaceae bacterium]
METGRVFRGVVLLAGLSLLMILLGKHHPAEVEAQVARRCDFPTGYCIEGPLREFWERHGGVRVFGYPISPQEEEYVGLVSSVPWPVWLPGQRVQTQRFERHRLELHPGNVVKVGRLGSDLLEQQGRSWWYEFGRVGPDRYENLECLHFSATGHNICGRMLQAWRSNGIETDGQAGFSTEESLALSGYPLSEEHYEVLEDDGQYMVQWFERARFEIHPESDSPFGVEFGRLGTLDVCTRVPAPLNADISPGNCLIEGTTAQVRVEGFDSDTKLAIWALQGDGTVYGPGYFGRQFEADAMGRADDLTISNVQDSRNHVNYYVFQDVEENRFAMVYYKVIRPENTPSYSAVSGACDRLPLPINAIARAVGRSAQEFEPATLPTCATQEIESLEVEAWGFRPGEEVHLTVVFRDGSQMEPGQTFTTNEDGYVVRKADDPAGPGGFPSINLRNWREPGPGRPSTGPGTYVFIFRGTQPYEDTGVPNIAVIPVRVVNQPAEGVSSPLLIVRNLSEQTICYIHVSPVAQETWGDDKLEEDEVLASGQSRFFEFPRGATISGCSTATGRSCMWNTGSRSSPVNGTGWTLMGVGNPFTSDE